MPRAIYLLPAEEQSLCPEQDMVLRPRGCWFVYLWIRGSMSIPSIILIPLLIWVRFLFSHSMWALWYRAVRFGAYPRSRLLHPWPSLTCLCHSHELRFPNTWEVLLPLTGPEASTRALPVLRRASATRVLRHLVWGMRLNVGPCKTPEQQLHHQLLQQADVLVS